MLSSFSVQANAATLVFGKNIELLYHNKDKVGLFAVGKKIELKQGNQQLVIRYNKLFDEGGDHDEVISEPIIIEFNVVDKEYLSLKVPLLSQQKKAQDFAKSPIITIKNSQQKNHPFTMHLLAPFSGFTFNRDILAEVKQWESSNAGPIKTQVIEVKKRTDDTDLEMLKFWYNKADNTSQIEFKQWLEQQK